MSLTVCARRFVSLASTATILSVSMIVPSAWSGPLGVPVPPNTELASVGERMRIGGMPVTVFALHSEQDTLSLAAFYERLWARPDASAAPYSNASEPGYMHERLGEAHVISHLAGSVNTVVHIAPAPGGGSLGSLSQVDISVRASADPNMKSIAVPPGGQLLSFNQSSDDDQQGSTWLASYRGHRDAAIRYYVDELARDGWSLANRWQGEEHTVLMFDGENARLDVVVGGHVDGDTLIVINRVTHDG